MKERFGDYKLVFTVPNDGLVHKAILPLTDGSFVGDWPFELRAVSFPRAFDVGTSTYPPYQSRVSIRTPDDTTVDLVPVAIQTLDPTQDLDLFQQGKPVFWRPFWPPIVWPARGVFELDFYNSSAATETVTVVLHGVHYVPDSLNAAAQLPETFSKEFYDYVTRTHISGLVDSLRDQILQIDGDADFVLCGITSAFRFPTFGYGEFADEVGLQVTFTNVEAGPITNTITIVDDSPDAFIHIDVVGRDVTVHFPAPQVLTTDLVLALNSDPLVTALFISVDVLPGFPLSPRSASMTGLLNQPPINIDILFKDQAGRQHSNALIAIRDQCQVVNNPASPRWFWPPVLLPRNGAFLFDLFRDDTLLIGDTGPTGDVFLRWIGFKVRASC